MNAAAAAAAGVHLSLLFFVHCTLKVAFRCLVVVECVVAIKTCELMNVWRCLLAKQ